VKVLNVLALCLYLAAMAYVLLDPDEGTDQGEPASLARVATVLGLPVLAHATTLSAFFVRRLVVVLPAVGQNAVVALFFAGAATSVAAQGRVLSGALGIAIAAFYVANAWRVYQTFATTSRDSPRAAL
jgi:hypothetical protein